MGPDTQPLRVGSALEPGRLRLESGLAQVVFYSGARVVIEGPTELQLISPTEAVCPAGRLLAEVPQPARGFRLKTAQLNLVDLGPPSALMLPPGQTEVHVFKGKVEFSAGAVAKQSRMWNVIDIQGASTTSGALLDAYPQKSKPHRQPDVGVCCRSRRVPAISSSRANWTAM